MMMEDTLSLDDLFGDDHFFTPEGDAVFLNDDCHATTTGQIEVVSSEPMKQTPSMTQVNHHEKIHVIDPTTSCESFLSTKSDCMNIAPVSTLNAVFPQSNIGQMTIKAAPTSFVSIIHNNHNHGMNSSGKAKEPTHDHFSTSSSINSGCETISSLLGYDAPIEAPPVTTSMTPDTVLSLPITNSKTTTATTSTEKQSSQFQVNPVGVFNPITGTYSSVNAALNVPARTTVEKVQSQSQVVTVPMPVPATTTHLVTHPITVPITNPQSQQKRRLHYDSTELAPRDKIQPIDQSVTMVDANNERRVRNREHARQSRLRKKILFESLENSVKLLREENKKLRDSIRQDVGNDQADTLLSKQSLSQVFAILTSKNIIVSDPPNISQATKIPPKTKTSTSPSKSKSSTQTKEIDDNGLMVLG